MVQFRGSPPGRARGCGSVLLLVLMADLRLRSVSADAAVPRFHTPLESPPGSPLHDVLRVFNTSADTEESGSEAGSTGLLIPPPPPSRGSSGSSPLLLLSDSSAFSDCDDTPPSRPRLPEEFLKIPEYRKQPPVPPRKLISITVPDAHRYLSQYAPSAASPRSANPVAFQVENDEIEPEREPSHALKKFTLSAEFQQLKDSVSEDEELEKLSSCVQDEPKSLLKTFTLTPEFQKLKESVSEDDELEKLASNRSVLEYDVKKQVTLSPDLRHISETVCELRIATPPLELSMCEHNVIDDSLVESKVDCNTESPEQPESLRKGSLQLKVPPKLSPEFYERVSYKRGKKREKHNSNEQDLAVEDEVKFKNTMQVEVERPWGWQKSNIVGLQPDALTDVLETRKPSLQLGKLLELYNKKYNVEAAKPLDLDNKPEPCRGVEKNSSTEPTTPRSKRHNFCCIQPSGDAELQLLESEREAVEGKKEKGRKISVKEEKREIKKSTSTEASKDRPSRIQRADMPYCRVLKLTASELRKSRKKRQASDTARAYRSDSPDRAPSPLHKQPNESASEQRLAEAETLLDFNVDTLHPNADYGFYDFEIEPYAKKPIERVESLYENRKQLQTMNSVYDNWKEKSREESNVKEPTPPPPPPLLPASPPKDLFGMPAFDPTPVAPAAQHMTMVPYSWWPVVETPSAVWLPVPPPPHEVGGSLPRKFY